MAIASINPATGEKVKEFAPFNDAEIEKRLKGAENASRKYRRTAFSQRSELLEATAELLLQEKERLAEIITLEMGKLFPASVEEILKCARACRFYAENAERFLEDEPAQTDASRSLVRYEPLGPLLAIMPWNFPFWQVFRFAAPALMAGNVAVLKHAANVPGCALAIEEIFHLAGFPAGVMPTLLMPSDGVGDPLDRSNDLGPLAREDLVQALHDQVQRTVQAGAALLTGGRRLDCRGYFYAPTVLSRVRPGMAAFEEETFGPVAAVVRARDADHAVELANRSKFGLAASIWTGNPRRGEELAGAVEARGCRSAASSAP